MKYKNGKVYEFKFGNVEVEAVFEGLTEKTVEKFYMLCKQETEWAEKEREEQYDGQRTYARVG